MGEERGCGEGGERESVRNGGSIIQSMSSTEESRRELEGVGEKEEKDEERVKTED